MGGQNLSNETGLRNNIEPVQAKESRAQLSKLTHEYIHAATSDNTRKAYQADIRHFIAWGGLLPTSSDVVMQYLEQHAKRLNPRTLVRRLTALKQWHLYQGFIDPTAHPALRKTLAGIKNVHGKPKKKALPITLETLSTMANALNASGRMIDWRNCALLQIGFFGAFRRHELVSITWEDILFVPEGIEILIPRSKTDQAGEGQVCAIPYGNETLCSVTALTTWRERSMCKSGYVFRQVTKGQQVQNEGIKPNQVNIILKSIAKKCGLPDAELYSSHSMRRGLASEASKNGAPFGAIMRQGRWRHEGTVLGYIDEGKRFDQNVVDIMLSNQKNDD